MRKNVGLIRRKALLIIFLLVIAWVFVPSTVLASNLSLDPNQKSVVLGSNFSSELHLDTQGQEINAVDITISYPSDILEVVSLSQGPNFKTVAEKSFGQGNIHLSAATLDPDSGQLTLAQGNVLVARIGFRAKKLGDAPVVISPDSVILSQSDSSNTLNNSLGATYNIQPKAPDPSSEPSDTPPPVCKNGTLIKARMNIMIKLADLLDRKLNRISSMLETYYNSKLLPQGKVVENYDNLSNQLKAKSRSVQAALNVLQKTADSTDCVHSEKTKEQFEALKREFEEYKEAIKEMINALETA